MTDSVQARKQLAAALLGTTNDPRETIKQLLLPIEQEIVDDIEHWLLDEDIERCKICRRWLKRAALLDIGDLGKPAGYCDDCWQGV